MPYNITTALLNKLIVLVNDGELPASDCKGTVFAELLKEGLLISIPKGRGSFCKAPNGNALRAYLATRHDAFKDLEKSEEMYRRLSWAESSIRPLALRKEQAATTGNSKIRITRSCKGFLVNCYEPIPVSLNGKHFDLNPPDGSYVFIADYENFFIPENVIVVGVENMENFHYIERQKTLFKQIVPFVKPQPLLFVARYPQSGDLIRWLCGNENYYVHFGDLDLAGVNIYLTEFYAKLDDRSAFFIPQDAEKRIANGSRERYDDQILKFENMKVSDSRVLPLVNLIKKHHKCYDQEGFIE